jgi:hypothetical protein
MIEDIPAVRPEVTEHAVHGYWCPTCRKIVYPSVSERPAQRHDRPKAGRLYRLASLRGRCQCQ